MIEIILFVLLNVGLVGYSMYRKRDIIKAQIEFIKLAIDVYVQKVNKDESVQKVNKDESKHGAIREGSQEIFPQKTND